MINLWWGRSSPNRHINLWDDSRLLLRNLYFRLRLKPVEELVIGDLRELIEFIPGVEMYDDRGISSQPTWIIRGVGLADLNANNTPTAARSAGL